MFRHRGIVHNYVKLANYFAASNPTVCFTFIRQWTIYYAYSDSTHQTASNNA